MKMIFETVEIILLALVIIVMGHLFAGALIGYMMSS